MNLHRLSLSWLSYSFNSWNSGTISIVWNIRFKDFLSFLLNFLRFPRNQTEGTMIKELKTTPCRIAWGEWSRPWVLTNSWGDTSFTVLTVAMTHSPLARLRARVSVFIVYGQGFAYWAGLLSGPLVLGQTFWAAQLWRWHRIRGSWKDLHLWLKKEKENREIERTPYFKFILLI